MESRRIARNTLWNLAGQVVPLLVALFAIPPTVRGLGPDRFGVLAIVWVVIGYVSLLDFGLGRVLTRVVAERHGTESSRYLGGVSWTVLFLMSALGVLGGTSLVIVAGWITQSGIRVPPELHGEMRRALTNLALSMPFVLATAGLRGILEARHRFGLTNAIRVPMAAYQFLAPVAMIPFTRDLGAIVLALVAGRIVAWLAYLICALVVMPELRHPFQWVPTELGSLVREGGWMMVTNVVGPILLYLDRFFLGAFASMQAVTYYTTPFELISRLLVVPAALSGVLFPSFASDHESRPGRTGQVYARGLSGTFLLIYPPILVLSAFAPEVLRAWVGEVFAIHGALVLRWLALGILVNSLAHLPFTFLQASGRSRLTARLHLVEVPGYALAAWWSIRAAGPAGAAAAWAGRALIDAVALFVMARRAGLEVRIGPRRWLGPGLAAIVSLAAVDLAPGLVARGIWTATGLAVFAATSWMWLLEPPDREWIRARLEVAGGR